MPNDTESNLARAARNLEERFTILDVPSRRVPASELAALPAPARDLMPAWLVDLLATYALVGGALEYRDRRTKLEQYFGFFDPRTFATLIGDLEGHLTRDGFLPFGDESNGSVWLLPDLGRSSDSPIYLLEHSAWAGGPPTRSNGLRFAAARLEYLLASMAVEVSFYSKSVPIERLMWFGGR